MTPRVLPSHTKHFSSTVRTIFSHFNRGGYIYNSGVNKEKTRAALAVMWFILQAVEYYGEHMTRFERDASNTYGGARVISP